MIRHLKYAAYLIFLFSICCSPALAQVKVNIADIQKIHLVDAQWALGLSRVTEFEVSRSEHQWVCEQTKQQYDYRGAYGRIGGKDTAVQITTQRKFVKIIDEKIITGFLRSIASVKPKFSPALLPVNAQSLINYADTSKYFKYYSDGGYRDLLVKELSKTENINTAIYTLQTYWHTDDSPYCGISIILKNNDTIKVETHRQVDYMLPWTLKGVTTYDLGINNFFLAVMNDYRFSARNRLNGSGLPYEAVGYIADHYVQIAMIKQDWQTQAPELYLKLLANFKLLSGRRYNGYDNDRSNECELNPIGSPDNLIIKARMGANDQSFLNKLLIFRDSLKQHIADPNFVIKYYSGKPVKIRFDWSPNGGSWKGLSSDGERKFTQLQTDYPAYQWQNALFFFIEEGYERFTSAWILLPDSKVILLRFMKPDVAGLKGNPLNSAAIHMQECFVLFDKDGNIIKRY